MKMKAKEDETGGTNSKRRKMRNEHTILVRKPDGKLYFKVIRLDGSIIVRRKNKA
jgi:hypothetical protein